MHLIHRPYRKIPKSEKFLALMFFETLFIFFLYSLVTTPSISQPPPKTEEKYYTIVLSEQEFSQLKELITTNHKELPSSIQKVQSPFK
jgi:hypothetical protein